MPAYLLIPLETRQPKWESSSSNRPVQVIAPSEGEARRQASALYSVRDATRDDPWLDPRLVYALPLDEVDHTFPTLNRAASDSRVVPRPGRASKGA